MKTKLQQTIIFLILISYNAFGQKSELDKVTKEELLEKRCPNDTNAAAAFLFKKAKTKFKYAIDNGFVSYTEFQIKLKIYKKEGLKWANFKMPYYVGYEKLSDESIQIESAYTYNYDNKKIVKTKVTNDGKFVDQINEYWKVKSLAFPNVKEGSIIELNYILKTENIETLPEFQFQYDIPVNNMEFITEIPEFYIYKGIKKGFVEITVEDKLERASQNFNNKHGQTNSFGYNQIKTKYSAKNIPAIKDESYVNNIDNYLGEIDHELQVIRMPEEQPKQIATTWESVAKSIYENKDFNEAISKFDYFSNQIKVLINGISSEEEKVKKIFSFVKNTMNWNGKYGYYPRRKMEIAYAEKTGNVAEINLMMVCMLRMAGIDANPVLVSTRENGFALFPNRTLFNYVIVAAKIGDKNVLMDATDKLSDVNMLPIRALNWEGRLIRKDGTSLEIDLMPKNNSKEIINIMANINQQGVISGKIRKQYFDYNAFVFRDKYNGLSKESYLESLEKKNQGIEIEEYDVQNNLNLDLPITENYKFSATNSIEVLGDKMYIAPFMFLTLMENPLKQEARQYPIDFVFPNQERFNISLTIPDGYVMETLPQAKAIALPENLGNFKYNISSNGNQIQLLYTQDINQAVIGAEYYEALKNFFKEIVNKQTEKIVLKKA
ncbi:transglutaminase domain-containing protein [Flavobacterium sp. 25HG05S-40]|uniref:transglutaminase domain-containing protein n=1 Tax=Flavobacterium sp. 25HG05S-40 TaxID=3458682 RepID=UPI00404516AE